MARSNDVDDVASRANDAKTPEQRRSCNRGGLVSDGKDGDITSGGKLRRPGRWVNYEQRED